MNTTISANQAVMGAALTAYMTDMNMGVVPVAVEGCRLEYGLEGSERKDPEPLVRLADVPLEPESIPGFIESGRGEGTLATGADLSRDEIEGSEFFKGWVALQEVANKVASVEQGELNRSIGYASSDFEGALIHHALGDGVHRVAAKRIYEEVAVRFEVERIFTSAAMVWERAVTNPDHVMPEKFKELNSESAARAWYKAATYYKRVLDPEDLKIARGMWYAYGSEMGVYRRFLLKSAKLNEYAGRKFESGADRLRLALTMLNEGAMNRGSWYIVSRMIRSAVDLFWIADRKRVDTDPLVDLSISAGHIAEGG